MPSLNLGYTNYPASSSLTPSMQPRSAAVQTKPMDSSGALLLGAMGMQLIGSVGSIYTQIVAQKMETDYKRHMLQINKEMAEFAIEDVMKRSEKTIKQTREKTRLLIGSHRAAMAAQGIDIGTGSAVDVQADTAALAAGDILTIRNNAYREAFGLRMQAYGYGAQSSMLGIQSQFAQQATIATGGMQFAAGALRDYAMYYGMRRGR